MKTIGYVLSEFPVLSETFVGNEMRAMAQLGHHIVPLTLCQSRGPAQPDDQLLVSQVQPISQADWRSVCSLLLRRPYGFLRALHFAVQQHGIRLRSALWNAAKLAVLAERRDCRHLHAHFALQSTTSALIAGKWLGVPVSFVGHGYDVYATPADLALKIRSANFVVAVCRTMRDDFLALEKAANVHVIPCGIELDKFQFQPPAASNQKLLFVGRLAEKKGLLNLLTALASIAPSARPMLDIVGDGPLRDQLEHSINYHQLWPWVSLLGAKTSPWIRQHANEYLALVAPFQVAANGDRDTGPLVLKEAMALGLPVISSALMGCVEIMDEHTGMLIEPGNQHALIQAIQAIQSQPCFERQELIYRARRRIEKQFNILIVCRRLSQLVEIQP